MKKSILSVALAVIFIPGFLLTSCKSSTQKTEGADENVLDARDDLKEAKLEANTAAAKAAMDEEWKAFKTDADAKLKKFELQLSKLKTKLQKPKKRLDEAYERKIEDLKKKNDELISRMNDYEKNQTDWESFKREFNRDMDELGNAFNALGVEDEI